MRKNAARLQSGFTLIELMVATTIFSIVLVVILASFLQVGRMYYKGVSVADTNESARTLADDVTNDIKIARQQPSGNLTSYFCIGQHRYSWIKGVQVKPTDITGTTANSGSFHAGVIQDNISGCCDPSLVTCPAGTNPQQLLGANMQLNKFLLNCSVSECILDTRVVYYGVDNTVLVNPANNNPDPANPDAQCSGNLLSTQFCYATEFKTDTLIRGI